MSSNFNNIIRGGAMCLTKAGLSGLSGAATTMSTTAAVTYANNGKLYSKATITGGATPTTDAVTGKAFVAQAANTACCYVFGLDASGNVKVAQGRVVPYVDTTANSTVVPFPLFQDALTPIGYAVIKAGATAVGQWTFGSSNWNATGIVVDTPVDVMTLPPTDPLTA